jgi:prophage maintenance system killer protein
LAAYVFLRLNGLALAASQAEAVQTALALAAGEIGEAEFSRWLAANSRAASR